MFAAGTASHGEKSVRTGFTFRSIAHCQGMTSKAKHPQALPETIRAARVLANLTALIVSAAIGCQTQPADAAPDQISDALDPAAPEESAAQSGTLIELREGRVQGRADAHTRTFTGIPYAAPPLGSLRWKPPQPVQPWVDTRDATGPGVACPQSVELVGPVTQSEDCLQLNVFAPAEAPKEPLPVMVWFHGGGNVSGSANEFIERPALLGGDRPAARIYDGAAFRALGGPDVVVVTVNYRLGALGFMSHPGLTHEQGASGNYGLMDQRAALRWVQRKIRAFGGDPDRVTIFGQGAGAVDSCYHLVADGGKDLIDAAVLETGTCASSQLHELHEAEAAGEALAAAVGCENAHPGKSLDCLRAMPASELAQLDYAALSGGSAAASLAIVDGDFLHEQPRAAIAVGRFLHVPTIVGSTANEAAAHFAGSNKVESEAEYRQLLHDVLGETAADLVAARYPVEQFESANDAAIAVATDALFACPARRFAARLSSSAPAYVYSFARSAFVDAAYGLDALHGAELLWIWNVWPALSPYTAEEVGLSGWLRGYWSKLDSGDVNAGDSGSPEWPRYSSDTGSELLIDDSGMKSIERSNDHCNVWDALPDAGAAMADRLTDSLTTSL